MSFIDSAVLMYQFGTGFVLIASAAPRNFARSFVLNEGKVGLKQDEFYRRKDFLGAESVVVCPQHQCQQIMDHIFQSIERSFCCAHSIPL